MKEVIRQCISREKSNNNLKINIMTYTLIMPDDLSSIETALSDYAYSLNTVWVLITAALVFFMQAGFALVEAGFTRSKNTTNILFKNLMDFVIGTIVFWAIGFGIMFGSKNGFMGWIGSIHAAYIPHRHA